MLPLASRMPVSMASLLRSDSVNPFRNSSNYKENADKFNACLSLKNKNCGHTYIPRDVMLKLPSTKEISFQTC